MHAQAGRYEVSIIVKGEADEEQGDGAEGTGHPQRRAWSEHLDEATASGSGGKGWIRLAPVTAERCWLALDTGRDRV